MFFANAERIDRKCRRHGRGQTASRGAGLSAVSDLEYTALKMLIEAEKRSRQGGVELWLVDLNPAVLTVVQRPPLGQTLGRERMFFNLEMATERYRTLGSASRTPDEAEGQRVFPTSSEKLYLAENWMRKSSTRNRPRSSAGGPTGARRPS